MKTLCNLCKSASFNTFQRIGNFNIVKCRKCGFVFTFTEKTRHVSESVYREEYFHIEDFKNIKRGYRSYEKDRESHKYYFEKKLDLIKKYLSSGKILDVGCALGFFMEAAKERGYDPFGIDVSKYAISYALKQFPKKVFLNTLKSAQFKAKFFDAVTLFQTIEHLDNPLETLREAGRILKKDGFLVIATPNHNCALRKIMRKYWFEYKPAEHLSLFDEKTMKFLLDKSGFSLVEMKSDIFYYPINYILERIAYYSPLKILNKISIKNNLRIPLPLGGIIIIAQKT